MADNFQGMNKPVNNNACGPYLYTRERVGVCPDGQTSSSFRYRYIKIMFPQKYAITYENRGGGYNVTRYGVHQSPNTLTNLDANTPGSSTFVGPHVWVS
jgi:hypothetical protein